ncbi:protein kinase [Streptomyces sp. NBC_00322]|uniref:protein kinase domain-containing protein n=1 Tax=Streptomyces sp. NBC_00322 TaxID=2975712 RepID=UPI002E2A4B28|nr:protein kinase [Streptomyces sp. NBC_00322]
MVGTPKYMSPEHALGKQLTPASDVFTLGLLAAEAASGSHPYGEGGGLVVATRIAGTDREPPDLGAHPPALREVLTACLAPRPEDRPSAAEVAALCGRAAGRDVRDFRGWLPKPLATAVAGVDRAAQDPRSAGWLSRIRRTT